MSRIAQILVAAGKGARFGSKIPKQYQVIAGEPLIRHTLKACCNSGTVLDQLIIVVAEHDDYIPSMIDGIYPTPRIVTGGATRTQSVRNGLNALKDDPPDFVLIHDAARPFVTAKIIQDSVKALSNAQASVPILSVADALKSFQNNKIGEDVERDQVRQVQTPQAFRYPDIWRAFQDLDHDSSFSDDIAVARQAGLSIEVIDGDPRNFKVTYPSDQKRAEDILSKENYTATGSGFDVHRIEAGDSLWLCGIEIPAGFSLKGHSDADVGLHALTDAILGALAEGDIGDHFPPSDPQWKGAASDKFLTFAVDKVKHRGGQLQHVDVTLICEKPKVKHHRDAMRQRISTLLALPMSRVSVKATTTEKLGFTGRGEGIAAQATATLSLPLS